MEFQQVMSWTWCLLLTSSPSDIRDLELWHFSSRNLLKKTKGCTKTSRKGTAGRNGWIKQNKTNRWIAKVCENLRFVFFFGVASRPVKVNFGIPCRWTDILQMLVSYDTFSSQRWISFSQFSRLWISFKILELWGTYKWLQNKWVALGLFQSYKWSYFALLTTGFWAHFVGNPTSCWWFLILIHTQAHSP